MFDRTTSSGRRALALTATALLGGALVAGCGGASTPGGGGGPVATAASGKLTTINIGTPNSNNPPQSVNFEIGDYLGYYQQQGLSPTFQNLGSPQAVLSALSTGKIDFAILPDTNITATAAKGEKINGTVFYEFAYPLKYGVAVNPDSNVHSLADLKGTTVGTDSFGQSEYNVGQVLLRDAGVGANDVHWLATGSGVSSGQALQRNRISALFYSDAGFGTILAAGMPMRFLPLGSKVPQIGGQMVLASDKVWSGNRTLATKLATVIGETSTFTLANPTAAAYAYLQQFPTAAAPGQSLRQQITSVELPVRLRMKLFPPPPGLQLGQVDPQNFTDALSFQGLKSMDVSSLYSNAVTADANKFDAAAVRKAATGYQVPGISGQVPVPTIPAGTP